MTPPVDPPLNRASLLTPQGRGAVAVIAAEGPTALAVVDAHFAAANRVRLGDQPIDRLAFGRWQHGVERLEEVIVCRTGASSVEVHCHGGLAAAEQILAALRHGGCEIIPWVHWTAIHADDPLEAEADVALAAATTRRAAVVLLDQRQGALRHVIEAALVDLSAGTHAGIAAAGDRVAESLTHAALGQRLTRSWHVAIAGQPNVGKSSLINALVGYERAIVFDQPGTTRDVLAAETAIDGWPVRLTDGAGLRETTDPLESAGVELAMDQLVQADLVAWVLDASTLDAADLAAPDMAAQRQLRAMFGETRRLEPLERFSASRSELCATGVPLVGSAERVPNSALAGRQWHTNLKNALVVVNKADLVAAASGAGGVPVSALTGAGLDRLLAAIVDRLVPAAPPPGAAVPITDRQTSWLTTAQRHLARGDAEAAARALRQLLSGAPAVV